MWVSSKSFTYFFLSPKSSFYFTSTLFCGLGDKMSELLLPKKYFVVSGKGLSRFSKLNAFDNALRDAGISHLNLVPVSSIIPPCAEEVKYNSITPGTVAFTVMAREDGYDGETIGAGIAWAKGKPYGYVVEVHGKKGEKELLNELKLIIEGVQEEGHRPQAHGRFHEGHGGKGREGDLLGS